MAKQSRIYAPGLEKLMAKLGNRTSFLKRQDGREVDLGTEKIFVSGPFLHQDTEAMTEQESFKFEIDNRELFMWLRSFGNEVKRTL